MQEHNCINLRLPTYDSMLVWEFETAAKKRNVCVKGRVIFNSTSPHLHAVLAGMGLTYIPLDMAAPHNADGSQIRVLQDWRPTFPGYHLYYPCRRHSSPAFNPLVEALRHR
ncbi:MAG: hypothetical protein HY254_11340 [Burkholderiales bacterium]|nr:hypothetical protein [Burkholderiales bacterium]